MDLLKNRILSDGIIAEGDILKVDMFLNHQMDIDLLNEMGKEFYRLFADCGVTKILTIESSGIGVSCITAQYFHVPVLFAKKAKTINISGDIYTSQAASYTHQKVYTIFASKKFLTAGERILILDDFLATGSSLIALSDLCRQAGASIVGAGIVIEKAYQGGGDKMRAQGMRVEALAAIESMSTENGVLFRD